MVAYTFNPSIQASLVCIGDPHFKTSKTKTVTLGVGWGTGKVVHASNCTTWEVVQEDREFKVILTYIFSSKMSQKPTKEQGARERAPWLMALPAHPKDLSLVSHIKMAHNCLTTLTLENPTLSRAPHNMHVHLNTSKVKFKLKKAKDLNG